MPDHDTHDLFDVWFYGCKMGEFRYIHQIIDQPWQQELGPDHRKIMHDSKAILFIEAHYGPMAALVAKSHIALDIAMTNMKKRGLIK